MIKKNKINMSPIYFIQTQYKNRKMKYCDTKIVFWRKGRKMNTFCVCVSLCACIYASVCFCKCACVSCGDDSEKVKVKRKIIGVSWSEKRRIQMDLIPSFSFDVSFPPFYCRLLCAQSVVPVSRVKERGRTQQHNMIVVVRLKLCFYSCCFYLDKSIFPL